MVPEAHEAGLPVHVGAMPTCCKHVAAGLLHVNAVADKQCFERSSHLGLPRARCGTPFRVDLAEGLPCLQPALPLHSMRDTNMSAKLCRQPTSLPVPAGWTQSLVPWWAATSTPTGPRMASGCLPATPLCQRRASPWHTLPSMPMGCTAR